MTEVTVQVSEEQEIEISVKIGFNAVLHNKGVISIKIGNAKEKEFKLGDGEETTELFTITEQLEFETTADVEFSDYATPDESRY